MAVFKDKKIAAQALSGDVQFSSGSWKGTLLVVALSLFICSTLALGTYVFISRPAGPVAPAVTEVQVIRPAAPVAAPTIPARHESARPEERPAEIVQLPEETRKVAQPTAKVEKIEKLEKTEKIAVAAKVPPTITPRVTGLYGEARQALRSGKAEQALEVLKQNGVKTVADEKAVASVLRGRAYLALGKIDEARTEFEALGALTPATEIGADAVLGLAWCQAGFLTRCRESELEQVREGAESWGAATALLESARRAEEAAAGSLVKLEEARGLYQQALDMNKLDEQAENDCLSRLTKLTNEIVLNGKTPCSVPKAAFHKVEAGDTVEKIARKYKVNVGQIKVLNRLNDKMVIRYGQVLKVLPGDVEYKVSRSLLNATLYIDGVFIRRYPVGIGPGNATPVGTYVIETKVTNPDWWYDGKRVPFGDANNILGTRWMGFAANEQTPQGAGLGVHGTAFPESVPGRESKGCVRMHNKDVDELYDLMPQGGKVLIYD